MIRLVIKFTFNLYIGTIKFSSLFEESPCSPVVTFPSFGSERHGVKPPHGDSSFLIFQCKFIFFYNLFLTIIQSKLFQF